VTRRLEEWDQRIRVDVEVAGCRLQLSAEGSYVYAEYGCVPPNLRQAGYGTALVAALTGWADRHGVTLRLGISGEYGTSVRVLRSFYGRHGFVTVGRIGAREMVRYPTTDADMANAQRVAEGN
jgi:GNAT superfamily N-acetyltransferase